MKQIDYIKLSKEILSIAKIAGDEILKIYNSPNLGITFKDDKSPLTLADKASNKVIEESLIKLTPNKSLDISLFSYNSWISIVER